MEESYTINGQFPTFPWGSYLMQIQLLEIH